MCSPCRSLHRHQKSPHCVAVLVFFWRERACTCLPHCSHEHHRASRREPPLRRRQLASGGKGARTPHRLLGTSRVEPSQPSRAPPDPLYTGAPQSRRAIAWGADCVAELGGLWCQHCSGPGRLGSDRSAFYIQFRSPELWGVYSRTLRKTGIRVFAHIKACTPVGEQQQGSEQKMVHMLGVGKDG